MVAVMCIVCQSTLPAFSCPCPNSKPGRVRAACAMRPPAKATQPADVASAKPKCARCPRAKGCASKKKAQIARSLPASASPAACSMPERKCEACPYRQAKNEPARPYIPTDSGRDQVVTSVQPIATVVPDLAEHATISLLDWQDYASTSSHSERQAQIMCWLK